MAINFNDNPVFNMRRELHKTLPETIVKRIDDIWSENPEDDQLKRFKRKRKVIVETGDLFLLQPIDNLYYLGQVIDSSLDVVDGDTFI